VILSLLGGSTGKKHRICMQSSPSIETGERKLHRRAGRRLIDGRLRAALPIRRSGGDVWPGGLGGRAPPRAVKAGFGFLAVKGKEERRPLPTAVQLSDTWWWRRARGVPAARPARPRDSIANHSRSIERVGHRSVHPSAHARGNYAHACLHRDTHAHGW
jgi:hypothetical protein